MQSGLRVFEGCDLQIAQGVNVSINATVAAMESSSGKLRRIIDRPKPIRDMSWEDLFATIVIPRLHEVHGREMLAKPFTSTPFISHADPDSGARLAGALVSADSSQSTRFVDLLLERGASFSALYREVFEPAQLQLGNLWYGHRCDDFHLAVGLARLQAEVRRVNAEIPTAHRHKPTHSVLLAAQPDEPHCVGLVMSSEVFERQGWDVSCHFPRTDQALTDVLQHQWFDVLKLSQSGTLRRDGRLSSIRVTIDAARNASLNSPTGRLARGAAARRAGA